MIHVSGQMMISDQTLCLFHAEIEERDGTFLIDVPDREISVGELEPGQTYRVAVLRTEPRSNRTKKSRVGSRRKNGPPVEVGETVEVEIEDIGEQGDGIARIGPGFIVFVSDTEIADRVTAEITQVKENFAFAEVVKGPY